MRILVARSQSHQNQPNQSVGLGFVIFCRHLETFFIIAFVINLVVFAINFTWEVRKILL